MRRRAAVVGILVATLLIGAQGAASPPAVTDASWTDLNYGAASVTTGTIAAVSTFSCSSAAGGAIVGGGSIGFTWSAPTGGTITPTGYQLSWSGTAGSGSTTTTGTSGSVPASGLGVGTLTVVVTATASGWSSANSTQTRTVILVRAGSFLNWTCT